MNVFFGRSDNWLAAKTWYSIDKQIPDISDEVVSMRMTTQCTQRLLFQSRSKQTTMKNNLRGIMLWKRLHYGKPWSLCSPPLCVLPVRWFLRRQTLNYAVVDTIGTMHRTEVPLIMGLTEPIAITLTIISVYIDAFTLAVLHRQWRIIMTLKNTSQFIKKVLVEWYIPVVSAGTYFNTR